MLQQAPLSHVAAEFVEFSHLLLHFGTPELKTQKCVLHHHVEAELRCKHRQSQGRIVQKLRHLESVLHPFNQSDRSRQECPPGKELLQVAARKRGASFEASYLGLCEYFARF
eukprot:5983004-Pleurochrysis_carterae.AAC.1